MTRIGRLEEEIAELEERISTLEKAIGYKKVSAEDVGKELSNPLSEVSKVDTMAAEKDALKNLKAAETAHAQHHSEVRHAQYQRAKARKASSITLEATGDEIVGTETENTETVE